MNISENGLDLIKQSEHCELDAYQDCAGIWTIGYGHTLNVRAHDVISAHTAEVLLENDLQPVENAISSLVHVPLNQNQFDALVSLTFNIGIYALRQSTLLHYLNNWQYQLAADEFLKWDRAGGKVVAGLSNRRRTERSLFLS
jgi:lysozyme